MMLEVDRIAVSYGEKAVLTDCSLSMDAGDHVALMSPSGCGKTTLLRVVLSLLPPGSGTVHCSAQRIAAVFQVNSLSCAGAYDSSYLSCVFT